MTQLPLQDKVAFITGGASGIGRATAMRFVEAGARVAIVDLKLEASQKLAFELGEDVALGLAADVSRPKEMAQAYQDAINHYGKLDIVFANAGQNGTLTPIEHLDPEDWDAVMRTNLTGTFLTVKYAIPYLKEQGGSIIITASINGTRYFKNFGFAGYATSKAGQVGFAKMAAVELARFGIRVNTVCPGAIDTNIDDSTEMESDKIEEIRVPVEYPEGNQPLAGGSGSAEQVADVVSFLASDASSHMTGSTLYVDGVESLL